MVTALQVAGISITAVLLAKMLQRYAAEQAMLLTLLLGTMLTAAAIVAMTPVLTQIDMLLSAGGLDPQINVGDIYEIDSAVQYDFDLSAVNGTTVGTLDERDTPYIPLATPGLLPSMLCGTGDRFNDSDDDNDLLINMLTCTVRDMECAAVAQVCETAGVKCVAFKCITDVRGKGAMTGQYVDNLKGCLAKLTAAVPRLFAGV